MRKDVIKNVTIKEPPIEELTRKYSTFSFIKRSCMGGCGCLVFLLIVSILILKFALGVGPQTLGYVPDDFPKEIPVYDKDNIESVTFISGTYKNRVVEIAAIFPKIILSPIISVLDKEIDDQPEDVGSKFRNMWGVVNSPVSDKRNVAKIKWANLKAEPNFVYSYYKTELKKQGYKIKTETNALNSRQFTFVKEQTDGSFYVKMDDDKINTILANLIVNYYSKATTSTLEHSP